MPAPEEHTTLSLVLADEAATRTLAQQLAKAVEPGLLITLSGPLAAGKTFFVRALLGALGHAGKVKSPTFTLVETYLLPGLTVHHFDLYRLASGEELHFIGFDDFLASTTLCLVEWPERGAGSLPVPDLQISIEILDSARRAVSLVAGTVAGARVLTGLKNASSDS